MTLIFNLRRAMVTTHARAKITVKGQLVQKVRVETDVNVDDDDDDCDDDCLMLRTALLL